MILQYLIKIRQIPVFNDKFRITENETKPFVNQVLAICR